MLQFLADPSRLPVSFFTTLLWTAQSSCQTHVYYACTSRHGLKARSCLPCDVDPGVGTHEVLHNRGCILFDIFMIFIASYPS